MSHESRNLREKTEDSNSQVEELETNPYHESYSKPIPSSSSSNSFSKQILLMIPMTILLLLILIAVYGWMIFNYFQPSNSSSTSSNPDTKYYSYTCNSFTQFNSFSQAAQKPCINLAQGSQFMVSSDNTNCSQIGLSILQELQGNAVDAAVAVALCLGVLQNFASGIGGGGVALVATENFQTPWEPVQVQGYQFRETAPLASHQNMFVNKGNASQYGPLSIGVPGEIHGLYTMFLEKGSKRVTWKQLVQPSVNLAKQFPVHGILAQTLSNVKSKILAYPELSSIYARNGKVLQIGDVVENPKLAQTLEQIGELGGYAFYDSNSPLGKAILDDLKEVGSIINATDMEDYTTEKFTPLMTSYHGYQVYGSKAPISGGTLIQMALNLLEMISLETIGYSALGYNYIIEALKFVFGHRMELGDPNYVPHLQEFVDLITSKHYANYLRQNGFQPMSTLPSIVNYTFSGKPLKNPVQNGGTSHFSIYDGKNGMAVSLTTTVNLEFGSLLSGSKTGIVFNDQMDDFSTPNTTNAFNLPPSEANYIAPGKRPLSSMSPTIITKNNRVYLIVGASGGSRIPSSTLQVILNVLQFGNYGKKLADAVGLSRIHHQLMPNTLWVEQQRAFQESPIIYQQLERLYSNFTLRDGEKGRFTAVVQAVNVLYESKDGRQIYGASDWRKMGSAAGK